VNNEVIEDLNNHQYNGPEAECEEGACGRISGKCMPHTSLQVSWSQIGGEVHAHTYLSKRPVYVFILLFLIILQLVKIRDEA